MQTLFCLIYIMLRTSSSLMRTRMLQLSNASLFFVLEVLVCKNNDLRALQAVNERHMSSNLTFKTLVAFTRVEISERWHLCETSGDSGTDWRTFHAPPGSVSSVWPFWKESVYFSSSSLCHTHIVQVLYAWVCFLSYCINSKDNYGIGV